MFGINVVNDEFDTVVAGWASGVVLRGGANQSCYRRPERRLILRVRRHGGKVAFPIRRHILRVRGHGAVQLRPIAP